MELRRRALAAKECSLLSIERKVMRERAVCKTARDRTLLQYSAIRVLGFCRVILPPEGGAGGSELSGRSRPGACGGARADGRERGEGGGEESSA